MRKELLIGIAVLILCSVQVMAIGIGKPKNLADAMVIDAGQNVSFSFVVKGDANTQMIDFFMYADPVGLAFSTDNAAGSGTSRVDRSLFLNPYDQKTVVVTVGPRKAGEYKVFWGYKLSPSSSGGVGFDQVVQQSFTVQSSGCPSCFVVGVSSNGSNSSGTASGGHSSSGSGGSGGSGGYYFPVTNVTNTSVVKPSVPIVPVKNVPKSSSPVQSGPLQDLSSDSSTNVGVVPGNVQNTVSSSQSSISISGVQNIVAGVLKGGRSIGLLVIVLFGIAAIAAGYMLKVAKEAKEEELT